MSFFIIALAFFGISTSQLVICRPLVFLPPPLFTRTLISSRVRPTSSYCLRTGTPAFANGFDVTSNSASFATTNSSCTRVTVDSTSTMSFSAGKDGDTLYKIAIADLGPLSTLRTRLNVTNTVADVFSSLLFSPTGVSAVGTQPVRGATFIFANGSRAASSCDFDFFSCLGERSLSIARVPMSCWESVMTNPCVSTTFSAIPATMIKNLTDAKSFATSVAVGNVTGDRVFIVRVVHDMCANVMDLDSECTIAYIRVAVTDSNAKSVVASFSTVYGDELTDCRGFAHNLRDDAGLDLRLCRDFEYDNDDIGFSIAGFVLGVVATSCVLVIWCAVTLGWCCGSCQMSAIKHRIDAIANAPKHCHHASTPMGMIDPVTTCEPPLTQHSTSTTSTTSTNKATVHDPLVQNDMCAYGSTMYPDLTTKGRMVNGDTEESV